MPLFHVVKAKSKEEAEQEALDKLKKALTGNQVMSYFVPHHATKVIVDASLIGLGPLHVQNDKDICYASRVLSDVETRHSRTEKQMLAVVWAVVHTSTSMVLNLTSSRIIGPTLASFAVIKHAHPPASISGSSFLCLTTITLSTIQVKMRRTQLISSVDNQTAQSPNQPVSRKNTSTINAVSNAMTKSRSERELMTQCKW